MSTRRLMFLLGSFLSPMACFAQWSNDPAANNPVADGPSAQVLCKVATHSSGSTYISWFQHENGNYNVRLQRLDRDGNEAWPHNGILVSDKPQNTSLVDYHLTTDAQGNALIVFTDLRNGPDLDPYAYRVSPSGEQLWGADGVTLCNNDIYEPDPRICQLANGDFVAVWPRPNANRGGSGLVMQIIYPDGSTHFETDGILLDTGSVNNENPAFCELVPLNDKDSSFVVSWVRDIRSFSSPRHVRAQRYTSGGVPQWNGGAPLIISDATVVPIAHRPRLREHAGEVIVSWHDIRVGNSYSSWVQRVSYDGQIHFAEDGLQVSTDSSMQHLDPDISISPAGDIYVAWTIRNSGQSLRGLAAQRISQEGERLWSDSGVTLLPLSGTDILFPRIVANDESAMIFCLDAPSAIHNRVIGFGLDGNGVQSWADNPLVVSSSAGTKGRLPVGRTADGDAVIAWEDNRKKSTDIYAQLVTQDGFLGGPACNADWNADDVVNSQDFFDFLTDFFKNTADFNNDGATNSQDFFDFLADFFTC